MNDVLNCRRYFLLGCSRGTLVLAFYAQTFARLLVGNHHVNIASGTPNPSCSFDFCRHFQAEFLDQLNNLLLFALGARHVLEQYLFLAWFILPRDAQ